MARKVRSPVELAVGLLRSLQGSTDMFAIPLPSAARSKVVSIPGNRFHSAEMLTEGLHALFTLPEFQLS